MGIVSVDRPKIWLAAQLQSVLKSFIGLNSRARQARATSGIGVVVGLVFSIFNLLTPGMLALGLTEFAAVALLLFPASLISTRPGGVAVSEALITAATATILGALVVLGGLQGTGLFWAYLAPFLAFFLKGQALGWRYSSAFFAGVVVYLFTLHDALPFAYPYSTEVKVQFALSLMFYTLIAATFNRLRDHYEKGLKQHLKDLTAAQTTSEVAVREAERAFAEMKASRDRMDQILWSANLGTWELNVQSGEVVFNERCAAMLGRTLAEIGGSTLKHWVAFEHPSDFDQASLALERCIQGASPTYEREGRMRHKDGGWIWVLDRGRVVQRASDGEAVRLMGTRQDITERKSADERQLRAVLEASADAMLLVSTLGQVLFANSVAQSMFGYTAQELLQLNVDALVPSEMRPLHAMHRNTFTQEPASRAMNANAPLTCLHKSGRWMPVEVSLSPFTLHGEPLVIANIADVSERVANQKQLIENQVKLRKAQEIAGFGNYMMDLTTGQWESSPQLDAIYGIGPGFCYDIPSWNDLLDAEFRQPSLDHYLEVAAGRCDLRMDYRITRPCDGQQRWVAANGELERDAAGTPVRLIGTIQDITQRKQTEARLMELNENLESRVQQRTQELGQALEKAEIAKRSRGDFLSNMSHEIRTPMNAVLGMVYLALQTNPSQQQRDYLEKIQSAGGHMVSLINDILDFSKIDAGKLDLEPGNFDLHRVLQNVVQLTEGKAREKGLQLACELDPDVPQYLWGDALRLGQIVINYVNNAIKFTERGSVILRVAKLDAKDRAKGSSPQLMRFEVQDTGIGVSEPQQQRLFQSFEQADNSITRKYGGTGLGLAICKQLAALMGGQVGLESRLGVGSTFWFTALLDVASSDFVSLPASSTGLSSGEALRGTYMLVVDDSAFNLEVAKGMLEGVGVHVMLAGDGAKAIELVRECRFDCVLMDMRMPVMDGLQATRTMRMDANFSTLPVVGLTANANSEDHAQCLQAGMNAVVTKPIHAAHLFATLVQALGRSAKPALPLPLPLPLPASKPADAPSPLGLPALQEPSLPVWDADALQRRVGNYPSVHRRLIAHFQASAPAQLAHLGAAVDQGHYLDAAEQAHKLKSAANTVGALRFGDLCDALERAGRRGDMLACMTLRARLPSELEAVADQIHALPA
jgi:PAS domain S-box-containing protein